MLNIAFILLPCGLACVYLITLFTFQSPALTDTFVESNSAPHNPHNTIIIFDIHGVLFKPDYGKLLRFFWHSNHKMVLLRHSLKPGLWMHLWRLKRNNVVIEKMCSSLAKNYPQLASCLPLFTAIANAQQPIHTTVHLVQQLKNKGYTLHILSNIGEEFFKHLASLHADIFAYFDAIKVTSSQENYIGKPNPLVFQNYVIEHNPYQKYMIFIDDTYKNIKTAQTLGFIGIRYLCIHQLQKQLHVLCI